jgi:uncharacterized cupredoxin-like copper-binding protein
MGAALVGLLILGSGCGLTERATHYEMSIEHSSFGISEMRFAAGDTVRFVVTNDDPIDHELIIGDQRVQDIHERGSEAIHGAVPGEITVPAGETRSTIFTFDEAGELFFACHLPGHFAYGMHGSIVVAEKIA